MKNLFIVAAAAVLGLSACGGNAKIGGGKQGAAEALMAASTPTKQAGSRAAGGIDTADSTFNCPEGGTAKMSGFTVDVAAMASGNIAQNFTMTYNNCGLAKSDAGTAVYNGTWNVSQTILTSGGNVAIDQKFVGKITIGGAFNDFLDANVTQSVNVSDMGTTGSVSIKLVGTIATSAGSNTYNESVNVTGGTVTVDASSK